MKYRKKPVEIEAKQLGSSASGWHDVYLWCVEQIGDATAPGCESTNTSDFETGVSIDPSDGHLIIRTLEGDMKAHPGDYLILGVQGELYPCRPDIFEQTYEPVVQDAQ